MFYGRVSPLLVTQEDGARFCQQRKGGQMPHFGWYRSGWSPLFDGLCEWRMSLAWSTLVGITLVSFGWEENSSQRPQQRKVLKPSLFTPSRNLTMTRIAATLCTWLIALLPYLEKLYLRIFRLHPLFSSFHHSPDFALADLSLTLRPSVSMIILSLDHWKLPFDVLSV